MRAARALLPITAMSLLALGCAEGDGDGDENGGLGGGPSRGPSVIRASLASDGTAGNMHSTWSIVASSACCVVYESRASNLVAGDTNGWNDVFVHDVATRTTTRVSVASDGTEAESESQYPAISADGRFVAFDSSASNLVAGDTVGGRDVFVHDRQSGQTVRVSVDSVGTEALGNSYWASISDDGRIVAFSSTARNLVTQDTNYAEDVFVHDRETGETTRVSLSSTGLQGNRSSAFPSISGDGRFVTFVSWADTLVDGDTNGRVDVFVHDRVTRQTTRASVATGGAQANADCAYPSVSDEGRIVAFSSTASTLVSGDTNDWDDVFVHDRETGETTRVSVSSAGAQSSMRSVFPKLSSDGRFVAFQSGASNLVAGDTNNSADIFVHDRTSGETFRVSINAQGVQGAGSSDRPDISGDGGYVVFESYAANLVPDDGSNTGDIFFKAAR